MGMHLVDMDVKGHMTHLKCWCNENCAHAALGFYIGQHWGGLPSAKRALG